MVFFSSLHRFSCGWEYLTIRSVVFLYPLWIVYLLLKPSVHCYFNRNPKWLNVMKTMARQKWMFKCGNEDRRRKTTTKEEVNDKEKTCSNDFTFIQSHQNTQIYDVIVERYEANQLKHIETYYLLQKLLQLNSKLWSIAIKSFDQHLLFNSLFFMWFHSNTFLLSHFYSFLTHSNPFRSSIDIYFTTTIGKTSIWPLPLKLPVYWWGRWNWKEKLLCCFFCV